jgi:hypothetical protein
MGAVFDPNRAGQRRYECPICLKKFDSELQMAVHFNMDHHLLRRGSR